MEYVAGCTLRDVLRERGALQPRAALDILEPVLAALGAAHRAGFVHRDMKPENVLIGDDGRVKVADFGLVRAVDTVTNTTGSVLGTVSYLAPEQIEHGTADPRVDVYACGVVLYEMLTGDKPHSGDSPAQVLYQHLNADVPPPSAAVPGLPVVLDDLVASSTARNPEVRPYDAVALLAEVLEARGGLSAEQLDAVPPKAVAVHHDNAEDRTSVIPRSLSGQRPLPVNEDEAALNRTSRLASPPVPPRRRPGAGVRRRRGMAAIVAAVLLVLGVGAGVWYINSGQFTKVPAVLEKTEDQARDRLEAAGLDVKEVRRDFSDTVKRGTVSKVDPGVGERIRENDSVTLTISKGPEVVKVPDLEGETLESARDRLKSAGLAAGMVTRDFSEDVDRGSVIGTEPGAGTERHAGSAIAITVSKGRAIDVPDVTGSSVEDATEELEDAGLKVEVAAERVTSSEFDKGEVAEQKPGGDEKQLAEGDTVTLTLSKGPEMIEVPDVVGDSVDDATRKLEDAGFEVDKNRGLLGLFGDTVESQSVDGGDKAPKGSTISIEIR
jgi:serine/threonine-protein kinase